MMIYRVNRKIDGSLAKLSWFKVTLERVHLANENSKTKSSKSFVNT